MKNKIVVIIVSLLVLVGGAAYFRNGKGTDTVSTAGTVEGTEVSLSSKVSGRISEFCCREGDNVTAGSTLVRLEADDIRASVEQARAGVARARADISSAEASVTSSLANVKTVEADIGTARADLEKANSQLAEAEKELRRAESLYKTQLIPNRDVDLAKTIYDTARASTNAAEAKLNAAISKKDAAEAQLATARSMVTSSAARVREAEAALKFQESRLRDMEITTPISGAIVFKGMETGEVVSPGVTILTIVDLENLWVRIDLEETLIGFIKVGEDVDIHVDGIPGTGFKGVVAEIGREADFATQKDVTRGRQDIKTFKVKIKVSDKSGALKPGMTVRVELRGRK